MILAVKQARGRGDYSQVPGVTGVRDGLRLRGRLHSLPPGLRRDDGSFNHVLQRDKDVVVLEHISREALRMELPERVFHQIRPHAVQDAGADGVGDVGRQVRGRRPQVPAGQ